MLPGRWWQLLVLELELELELALIRMGVVDEHTLVSVWMLLVSPLYIEM